jgi:hypothetical protein
MKARRMRWAGHVSHLGKMRKSYEILIGKLLGKEIIWKTQA